MGQTLLFEMAIEDGRDLIEERVGVTAGFWVREADYGEWFLYQATSLVGKDRGTRRAYRRVDEVMERMPKPLRIRSDEVKVISPNDPITKAVLDLQQRYPGNRAIG